MKTLSTYNKKCKVLKYLRDYYKSGCNDIELLNLIHDLDSEIKEIDKSIGINSDGGHGNYTAPINSLFQILLKKR